MSTPTPEYLQYRADYQAMQESLQPDGRFPSPKLSGGMHRDAALLLRYVLDIHLQTGDLSRGQFNALENHISHLAHETTQKTLRSLLRTYIRNQRLQLQATYDAAFRAGYRARKILHATNAQDSYRRGYARGRADAQAAREAD